MSSTTTANREEIARFNALASTWWDPAGPMWPLHKLNSVRLPFILDTLAAAGFGQQEGAQSLEGLRVLDIGCGAGLLSESLARMGADVTGVDAAERNIDIARAHAESTGVPVRYVHGSLESIAGGFDVVLNMEVVEHVDNLGHFMARCCEVTRPGGFQFLATINRNVLSWLVAIVGAEYILRWLPRGTHQWRKFVTLAEAASFLEAGGCEVVDRRGILINPINRAYHVTGNTRVNYMLAARKLN